MKIYIDDPDELRRDYCSGYLTVTAIAEKHGLSVEDVQEFAIENDLTEISYTELVRRGVQLRMAYAPNGPETDLPAAAGETLANLQAPIMDGRQGVVRDRNSRGIDYLYAIAEMQMESTMLRLMAINDPVRFHPEDMRVKAAASLQGEKESFMDMLGKTVDTFSKIRDLGMKDVQLKPEEPAKGDGGVTFNNTQNNLNVGANKTALDENSKLAAVAGMLSLLKERRDSQEGLIIEHEEP